MERKIKVILSQEQTQKTFDSKAETLGQLKTELRELGINYEGMTFYEGKSQTELLSDDSILPSNLNWRGTVTNDLVFMLTTPNKKIASGVNRNDVVAVIKASEELKKVIKEIFGRAYTNVSTKDLQDFLDSKTEEPQPGEMPETEVPCNCAEALAVLVDELRKEDFISEECFDKVNVLLNRKKDADEIDWSFINK